MTEGIKRVVGSRPSCTLWAHWWHRKKEVRRGVVYVCVLVARAGAYKRLEGCGVIFRFLGQNDGKPLLWLDDSVNCLSRNETSR